MSISTYFRANIHQNDPEILGVNILTWADFEMKTTFLDIPTMLMPDSFMVSFVNFLKLHLLFHCIEFSSMLDFYNFL
jgi:hypothetical protein